MPFTLAFDLSKGLKGLFLEGYQIKGFIDGLCGGGHPQYFLGTIQLGLVKVEVFSSDI